MAVNVFPAAAGCPSLVLLHANGFSSRCYIELVEILSTHFRVYGVDARGHGESALHGEQPAGDRPDACGTSPPHAAPSPSGDPGVGHCNTPARAAADSRGAANGGGFPLPAVDLVDVVRSLRLERPFVFAHSVLATLALHAEALAPGLWAAAYLYEPVASVTPAQVEANRVAGRMLATGARARRRRWESAAAALASLRARPGFSPLTDRALQAYVESCCAPCADGGVELRCTIEAAVFESALQLASGVRALMHAVRCPVTLARGAPRPQAPDAFLADAAAGLAAAAPDGVLRTFAGVGHFGPLSHPRAVARDVGRQLLRLDRCGLTPPQRASKL